MPSRGGGPDEGNCGAVSLYVVSIITIEFQQALKEAQVLHVLDIRGSHVTSYKIPSGKAELDLNISNLDSGLFFYTIEINGKVNLGKIVLRKH